MISGSRKRRQWLAYAQLAVSWGLLMSSAPAAVSNPHVGTSPIPVGAGPRALGMGGAFAAVADDASAVTWNPGGMTQLERPEFGLSVGTYHRRTRPETGVSADHHAVDLDHVSAIVPFHAFGCQQTIGLAWQRQFDFGRQLSASSLTDLGTSTIAQTTDVDVDGAFASLGLSYAIEPHPGFAIGATMQVWNHDLTGRSRYRRAVRESQTTSFVFPPITISSGFDEQLETEVTDGVSTVLGMWWQAWPAMTIAVVVKPSYRLRLRNTREVILTSNGTTVIGPTEQFDADFHYPTSATLGLAWRHGDLDTITCDVTWTDWSRYRVVEDGTTTSPVNAFIPPDDFSAGLAVRLGYEHLTLFDAWVTALRIGALYEALPGAATVPTPDQMAQTHATVDRYWGITAGASLCFEHLLYDLGVQVRHGREVGTGQDAPPDSTADVSTVTVRLGVAYQF